MKSRKHRQQTVKLWVYAGKGEYPDVSVHNEGTDFMEAWAAHRRLFHSTGDLAAYDVEDREGPVAEGYKLTAGRTVTALKRGLPEKRTRAMRKLFATLRQGPVKP